MTLTNRAKLAALGFGLVAAVAAPYAFRPFTVSIITLALIFGLYAMSIDLMAGYAGLVTLGHAGVFATGAYGVGYVASRIGGATGQQLLVGMAAGLVVTSIFALMAMRVGGTYFLMVTLAQGMIVWGFATRSTDLGAENGLTGVARPSAFSAYWKFYYLTLAIVLLCSLAMWVIVHSPFGLSLRGLKGSETRLQMLGYNPALTKFYVFMLAGLFGTVAGVMYAYYNQFVSPSNAVFATSGKGVLMAIMGGIGTLIGPVVGAFIIVFIENVLSVHIERWPTLLGLLFIFTILGARKGFVGALSDGWYRWVPGARAERSTRTVSPLDAGDDAVAAPEVKAN
ncbi:MAG: branched-chain amino acid ABC transporter permease [Nitriliruptorales bacterium]|nr:branched-chain amino acid ABC transporter permease [Nitriliruptorales bacterium]